MGGGGTFHTCLVEVEKATPEEQAMIDESLQNDCENRS